MAACLTVALVITRLVDLELINGLTEMSIKVIGWKIRCTGSDSSSGPTARSIMENSEATKDAVPVTLSGRMGVRIMANGKVESNMAMEYIPISLENKGREPGKTVEGSTGLQINEYKFI